MAIIIATRKVQEKMRVQRQNQNKLSKKWKAPDLTASVKNVIIILHQLLHRKKKVKKVKKVKKKSFWKARDAGSLIRKFRDKEIKSEREVISRNFHNGKMIQTFRRRKKLSDHLKGTENLLDQIILRKAKN